MSSRLVPFMALTIINCTGFLSSSAEYYQHVRCESYTMTVNAKGTCGYDFYENERVLREVKGLYATDLFVQRSVEIIKNHTKSYPRKVITE